MAVRVKVRIEHLRTGIDTAALVNSGFEAEEPLIILPLRLALKLGFSIEKLSTEMYFGIAKIPAIVYPLPDKVKISVLTEDRSEGPVLTQASISIGETEVILSDAVSSALRIAIDDLKDGLWRFKGEGSSRESVRKEEWL